MGTESRGTAGVGLVAMGVLLAGCDAPVDDPDALEEQGSAAEALEGEEAQDAFFESLRERCGDRYPGRAIIAPDDDDTFYPADLGMELVECDDTEVRITFWVDDDDSTSWLIQRRNEGLRFIHEQVDEDGELTDRSGWGGEATDNGTELFQHFPDHRWDPDEVPEDERSVWRLRLDPENAQFVYYLDRGLEPAYRLVFHMGQSPKVLDTFGERPLEGGAGSSTPRTSEARRVSAQISRLKNDPPLRIRGK